MPTYLLHKGEKGRTIAIAMTGADLSASTAVIRVVKPGETVTSLAATIDIVNERVQYTTVTDDQDVDGDWEVQAVVSKNDGSKITESPVERLPVGPAL